MLVQQKSSLVSLLACLATLVIIVANLSSTLAYGDFSTNDQQQQQHHHHHRHHHRSHGMAARNGRNSKVYIDGDVIVNATRDKAVTLTCVVHNVKSYKITWFYKGVLLTLNKMRIKDDKRYSIENARPNEWKLTIDPVKASDEGQYSCRLPNGNKRLIFLRVGTPPKFIGNNGSHQIVINTLENQNATLHCEAEGSPVPSIYWYKNNKQIAIGPYLKLTDINRYSHSEYECVARNTIEPDASRHFKINVNFKPSIKMMHHLKEHNKNGNMAISSEEMSSHFLNDGDLELVCEITGNPISQIHWIKDGKVRLHDRFGVTSRQSNMMNKQIRIKTEKLAQHKYISKLKIRNYDSLDNGVYECQADGFGGITSESIVINEIPAIAIDPNTLIATKAEYSYTNKAMDGEDHRSDMDDSLDDKLEIYDLESDEETATNKDDRVLNGVNDKTSHITNQHNLVESNYLIQGASPHSGRGARSNSTNLKEEVMNFFDSNKGTQTRLNMFSMALLIFLISTTTIKLLYGIF